MADSGITLWYLLVDQSHIILSPITSIEVNKTLNVDKLKKTIQRNDKLCCDVDPRRLNVYSSEIWLDDEEDERLQNNVSETFQDKQFIKLSPKETVPDVKGTLIIEVPQTTFHYMLVSHSHRILAGVTEVTVDNTRNVRELMEAIKEKEQDHCRNTKQLTLYRSKIPLHDEDEESCQTLQSEVEAFFETKPKPCEMLKIKSINIPVEAILLVELSAPGPVGRYLLFDDQRILVPDGSVQLENDAQSINDLRIAIIRDNSTLLRGVGHNQLEVYKCPEGIDSSNNDKQHAQVLDMVKDKQHNLRVTGTSTRYRISAGGLLLVKVAGVIRLNTDRQVPYILVDCEKKRIGADVVSAYQVADFKKAVKEAWSNELRLVDAGKLIVWRRTNPNPFTTDGPESISFTDDTAIVLEDMTAIASQRLSDDERLIVQKPYSDRTKIDSDSRMASLFQGLSLDDFQRKRLRVFGDAAKESSPSKAACVTSFLKLQVKNPIYNGRPAKNSGGPVGLYHDAFNTFHAHLNRRDLPRPHASVIYENVAELLDSFANIYEDETSRSAKIMPLMTSILGHPIDVTTQSGVSRDGTIKTSCGEFSAFLAIVEMKNEIGTGKADPYNQASLAYRKYWADKKHERMVPFCHFPSFLVAIAGPWIMIAGAIYLDEFIVEPLTEYIWLGGAPLDDSRRVAKAIRLFAALEAGISELKSYYEGLDMRWVLSKFPFITRFGKDEPEMRWKYCSQPYPKKLVYEAELEDGRQVIVKFASTYNEDAHKLLANEGYAPKLHHVSKRLYGGRQMVVMDRVTGRRLGDRERLTASQCSVLEEALRLLHAETIVHGDLRGPNIIIMEPEEGMDEGMKEKNREVMLIDFDECGKAGEGRYPADLNMEIGWPQGVGQEFIMQVAHDIEMLNKLKPR